MLGELDSYTQMNQTGILSHTILKKKEHKMDSRLKSKTWTHKAPGRRQTYPKDGEVKAALSHSMWPQDCVVHRILQARTLEWMAIPFSRGVPNLGTEPCSPES